PYVVLMYNEGIVGGRRARVFAPADYIKRSEFVKILCGVAGADTEGAEHGFTDVVSGSWYEPYVAWAAEQGIVGGVSAGKFAPDRLITRQDMATMIYRYVTKVLYPEVPSEPAEPSEPIGPTLPVTPITPEDPSGPEITLPVEPEPPLVTMSENSEPAESTEPTESLEGDGLPVVNEPVEFTDGADIAEYAVEAVSAMQQAGIIGGVGNPDGTFRFEPKNNATREQACKMLGELFLIINEDMTLPEAVQPTPYTIKYVTDFGEMSGAPKEYRTGEGTKVPNPVKEGYAFLGWSGTGLGRLVKDLKLNAPIVGDLTLTAVWTPTEYKITYELNGGTVSGAPTGYTIETNGLKIPNPVKHGSVFKGWKVNGAGGSAKNYTINRGRTGDMTLTAVWEELPPQEYVMRALAQWADERDEDTLNGVAYYREDTSASTPYPSSMWISVGNLAGSTIASRIYIDKYTYVVELKLNREDETFKLTVEKWKDENNIKNGNMYLAYGSVSYIGNDPEFTMKQYPYMMDGWGNAYNLEANPDEEAIRAIAAQELVRMYNWLNDIYHNRIKSGKFDMTCFGL
ncbi:MAG: S-layer homology domain-containing protein, partial [Clostridia bacterium]|nr:S-layer homology domain-containing protein [Clostridia bacterium]